MCFKKFLNKPNNNSIPSDQILLPPPKNLVSIDNTTINNILNKVAPVATKILSDSIYSTTSIDELRRFIRDDKTNEYRYISEYYDCDDYSFRLMGMIHSIEWGALPFGIILVNKRDWIKDPTGKKLFPHAMNCFIDSKQDFWLIEPQNDQVFHINSNYKPYFIMI